MFDDLNTWLALVSATAAWVAALFAYRSARIAKRSLELSARRAKAREPQLVPYLIDGIVRPAEKDGRSVYAFSVSLSNRADTDNALAAIELKVVYKQRNGTSGNLVLPHDGRLLDNLGFDGARPLGIPHGVGAHDTIAGWAMFELDHALIGEVDLEGYKICFLDTHGVECTLEPIIIREIVNEPTVAQR